MISCVQFDKLICGAHLIITILVSIVSLKPQTCRIIMMLKPVVKPQWWHACSSLVHTIKYDIDILNISWISSWIKSIKFVLYSVYYYSRRASSKFLRVSNNSLRSNYSIQYTCHNLWIRTLTIIFTQSWSRFVNSK